MDVPGRGISSVFLLLAFNIGFILCQNVGQECPFSVPHQGEVYNEYNPVIANLQQPKNNIRFYPAKRPPTGPTGAKPECRNPPTPDNVYPNLIQQALVSSPEPYPNFGDANYQSRPELLCSTESCNGQGAAHPYSEPLLNPSPCPEQPITPCSPQNPGQFDAFPQSPFKLLPHGISRGPFSPRSFTNPDRSAQMPVNDDECPEQNPPFSSNNAFTSISIPNLRNFFTPLVPYPNSRLPIPCADIQPSLFPQSPSIPVELLNTQGCPVNQIDVLPLQQSLEKSTREQENPTINYPRLNLEPEQVIPSASVNCLPQSPSIKPCDTTPLVLYPNSRSPIPCADIQPSLFPQGLSVPVEPLSKQGCLPNQIDVLPLQQSREQDKQMINYPPLNLVPERALPSPPVNSLPPSPAIKPCDTLPENQPCSSISLGPSSIDPFHDPSSLSTCDQCKVTRSLCSCPVSSCQSCQPACHCSVCDDEPSLFQIDTCIQIPHSNPSCVYNENFSPHQHYSDFHPSLSLNPGCCSCTNNDFFMPQPCCTPQSCGVTQTCGTTNNCCGPSRPHLSCDCSPPCSSTPVCLPSCESPCSSPEPINVQINVPPPIIPAPSITIINTAPEPAPASIDSGYFDTSPLIIDSRRRKSKSWLPLLLVWLFSCY